MLNEQRPVAKFYDSESGSMLWVQKQQQKKKPGDTEEMTSKFP